MLHMVHFDYKRPTSTGGGRSASRLSATTDHTDGNALNEAAEALGDEAKKTIAAAMNGLPDDVLAYVMAYTPASYHTWSFFLFVSRRIVCMVVY